MIIPGIPTKYNGFEFRSRLEARWAAFFDLLGWHYEYEPYDLNGWIPDFALYGKVVEVLVEVKPFSTFEEFDLTKIETALLHTQKEGTELLLLGSTLFASEWNEGTTIGWLGEGNITGDWEDDPGYCWGEACLNYYKKKWGVIHGHSWYLDRITDVYDGDGAIVKVPPTQAIPLWRQASNKVKWRPKKSATAAN